MSDKAIEVETLKNKISNISQKNIISSQLYLYLHFSDRIFISKA